MWDSEHPRYDKMLNFCRDHNKYADYQLLGETLDAEAFCNMAVTLCHFTDKMFFSYLKKLEEEFVRNGGIKERMHAARTGYRQEVDARLKQLETENERLKAENESMKKQLGL